MPQQTDHVPDIRKKATKIVDTFYQHLPLNRHVISKEKYISFDYDGWVQAKKCAIDACNMMLDNAGFIWVGVDSETGMTSRDLYRKHWNEIKQEIENL